jgi:tripartite ATP-independent transporter DctP family solute receptor
VSRVRRKLLLLPLVLLPLACASREEGVERWRFAIEETAGSVQDAYARRFEELIETRTDGAVDVTIYPYGALGTSDQITEQLHAGIVQFAMASPGHLGKLIPEVQVFLVHFLLSDDEEVNHRALSDPELLATFDRLYAEKGFKLLSFFSEGWQVWTTRVPVRRPEDFEGVKFRVMTSPLLLAAYQAYGASPTPLAYSEVYSALQLNMIDGQVNPIFAIQEMSFYEVTDYLVFAHQAPFITSAVASRRFYDALSPERRRLLDGVVQELDDYVFRVEQRFNRERLDLILERKPELEIIRLDDEQRARFREAARGVRARFVELVPRNGKRVLSLVESAVERARRAE